MFLLRTLVQLLKQDRALGGAVRSEAQSFNKGAYRALLRAMLIESGAELDVDLLLMIKEEVHHNSRAYLLMSN